MDSASAYPLGYQVLNDDNANIRPPPGKRRNIPRYHTDFVRHNSSSAISSKHSCFKWLCCFYCCLVSLVIFVFFVALALYALYKPQLPAYKVESFDVNAFDLNSGMKLNADISMKVKAKNPNAHIRIRYEMGSSVSVLYREGVLCSGKLPTFVQPGKDLRDLKVFLKGKSEIGPKIHKALVKQKNSGKIPLVVRIKAPITIEFGELPLQKLIVSVKCSLVVDKLSTKSRIKIFSSHYKYKIII